MRPSHLTACALAGALGVVAGPGCFYVDPINQRPAADIRPASSAPLFRGATVVLDAVVNDPEGKATTLAWRAYACADATSPASCDAAPFFTATEPTVAITVPSQRADNSPTQALRVVLAAKDDLGATTKPDQELALPVLDAAPILELRKASRYGFVVGAPVELYAAYHDPDDAPGAVTLGWQVFSPSGSASPALAPLAVLPDPDPSRGQAGRLLTPDHEGDWDVMVTATDALGVATVSHLAVTVVPDQPPCIDAQSPIVPLAPAALPLVAPTRFEVLAVRDDLDPYPTVAGDAVRGGAAFTWSVLPPGGGARQVLAGATGNAVELDPAAYTPGDALELRVEIADRNQLPVSCPDGAPTCAIASVGCLQRQTWRVVIP
jgi:hypothetical protein